MFIFLPECCYYLIVSDTDIGFLIIAVRIFAELIGAILHIPGTVQHETLLPGR